MTRKSVLVSLVAVVGLVGLLAVAGLPAGADGADDRTSTAELTDRIDEQANATAEAVTLANSPWVPRTAGLGVGLAVGLLVGGLVAYVTRGESG